MIKNLLLGTFATLLLAGCMGKDKPEAWTLYIYPDSSNEKNKVIIPYKFNSIESCRKASKDVLMEKGLESASYKCGKNCEYHEGMKLDICEEMKK